MKNFNGTLVILTLLVLGGMFFYLRPHQDSAHVKPEKEIYYCPMHPHYTSDKPGSCPICGMTLVKREQGHQQGVSPDQAVKVSGYSDVSLPAQKQKLIGMKTAVVKRENAFKAIRAYGRVTTNHELYTRQDEYIKAYTQFVTTYRDYQRYEHKRRNWESHRELQVKLHEAEDELLRLGLGTSQMEQLQKVSWQTPWDQPGLLFSQDHLKYWVAAQIFEGDLGYIEANEEVAIEIPSYQEKARGVVRSIGGIVDSETRTAIALIELTDYRGELKGNMLVNASIEVPLGDAIIVPREAVMDTGIRKIVFVQRTDETFEPRVIEAGWNTDEGLEVKSGLEAGERIVVDGNFLLDSESRIQAGLQGMTATEGGEHVHSH